MSSSKTFKCEACRRPSETLHMRDSDGKWVCAHCIPAAELNACAGLRERLRLKPAAHAPRRKAA
jgi:ribosomal protein L37AE/L43A